MFALGQTLRCLLFGHGEIWRQTGIATSTSLEMVPAVNSEEIVGSKRSIK